MPQSVQSLVSRLTFRQLQVFKSVYELSSYSRAGDMLGLSQPAVSHQIRQLEQALQQPLFEYVGRQLYSTATANRLAQCIGAMFNEIQSFQDDLSAETGLIAGELTLVAVSTAQYVVPYLLRAYTSLHPKVTINVKVMNRAAAIERLNESHDELTIMGLVPNDKPIVSIPFLNNELVAVVPRNHPLLAQQEVTLNHFLEHNVLLREAGSGSRLALELHCQKQRVRLQAEMEIGSNDAIKHAVIAGLGVAVLPKLGILSELTLGALVEVPIKDFPLRRSWCLIHPQARHPTPAMRSFIDYIQQNIGQFETMFSRMADI
ncbi:LysR family transcriptional regulator [Marinomonas sp. M1K-6]|uniref:LysR family transcriptional regulator n=1 Tax=Marinomonas profundi TaxID=2726122 RepID=A0A847QWK2_9GAMM|nr:LysR family transcriptional regulator [Marinomonas profundi]NLQ17768.1 LysR family transcriptional regulator [Marinomonas profundi]UDV04324.1 LysR family transcriptional regulator [Marinomonas profundi]